MKGGSEFQTNQTVFPVLILIANVSLLEINPQLVKRFIDAAHFDDVTEVVDMLHGGIPIDSTDENGYTALYWATNSNHSEIVTELLKNRVDVNVQNGHGWTPLHTAAENNNTGIMIALLEHGADPSIRNIRGQTALDVARMFNREEVTQLLENY